METLQPLSKTFKIFVPATEDELRGLLLLITTRGLTYTEHVKVITDYSSLVPGRTITFSVPKHFPISTHMITDWLMSMNLLGGYVERES